MPAARAVWHSSLTRSAGRPMIAPIAPGRCDCISAMRRPRSDTSAIPSAGLRHPAATAAVYSPRLCPVTKSGCRPAWRASSVIAIETANSAGWATSVRVSSSIGPSRQRVRMSSPEALLRRLEEALHHLRASLEDVGAHADALRALPRIEKGGLAHREDITHRRPTVLDGGVG